MIYDMNSFIDVAMKAEVVIFYGAGPIARMFRRYFKNYYPELRLSYFAVTSMDKNPEDIDGVSVTAIDKLLLFRDNALILLAVAEKHEHEIYSHIIELGFKNIACLDKRSAGYIHCSALFFDLAPFIKKNAPQFTVLPNVIEKDEWFDLVDTREWEREEKLAGIKRCKIWAGTYINCSEFAVQYLKTLQFSELYREQFGCSIDVSNEPIDTNINTNDNNLLRVYNVFCAFDVKDRQFLKKADWLIPIQAGAALTEERFETENDANGDSISDRNGLYSEMSAMYWIWKNAPKSSYKGLYHFRRHLLLSYQQFCTLAENEYDVILPVPRMVFPSIREFFGSKTKANPNDIELIQNVIKELHPNMYDWARKHMSNTLYYPCNILIARENVFNDCCGFVFSILFTVENINKTNGANERGRYIGYLAEILTSIFFSYHSDDLKIAVTDINQLS